MEKTLATSCGPTITNPQFKGKWHQKEGYLPGEEKENFDKREALDLSENPVAWSVHGRHARGDVRDGLIVPIPDTNVPISRLNLPPTRTKHDGPERVFNKVTRSGGSELEVGVLDLVERLRKKQHLSIHMGILPLCSGSTENERAKKTNLNRTATMNSFTRNVGYLGGTSWWSGGVRQVWDGFPEIAWRRHGGFLRWRSSAKPREAKRRPCRSFVRSFVRFAGTTRQRVLEIRD